MVVHAPALCSSQRAAAATAARPRRAAMALDLQSSLANVDFSLLKNSGSAGAFVADLARRCGVAGHGQHDLVSTFHASCGAIWRAKLGSWLVDYVAIVCVDGGFASSDPQQQALLVSALAAQPRPPPQPPPQLQCSARGCAAQQQNSFLISSRTCCCAHAAAVPRRRSRRAWARGWRRRATSCKRAWSSCWRPPVLRLAALARSLIRSPSCARRRRRCWRSRARCRRRLAATGARQRRHECHAPARCVLL